MQASAAHIQRCWRFTATQKRPSSPLTSVNQLFLVELIGRDQAFFLIYWSYDPLIQSGFCSHFQRKCFILKHMFQMYHIQHFRVAQISSIYSKLLVFCAFIAWSLLFCCLILCAFWAFSCLFPKAVKDQLGADTVPAGSRCAVWLKIDESGLQKMCSSLIENWDSVKMKLLICALVRLWTDLHEYLGYRRPMEEAKQWGWAFDKLVGPCTEIWLGVFWKDHGGWEAGNSIKSILGPLWANCSKYI